MFQVEKKEFAEHFTRGQRVSVANTCGDFMSDSSSLVSDLDETDYEVGRLTALAFRSLACPPTSYMELFESGGSTDLSLALSEDSSGTTQWSTPAEQGLRPASGQPGPRAAPPLGSGHFECVEVAVGSQEDSSGGRGEARTVPKREIQLKKRERSELSVFRASEASACPEERKTMSREEEVRASVLHRAEPQEESSKKAKFASCHISNVISKKMQFEQELKMERGAIQDPFSSVPSTPSSAHVKEFELPLPGLTQEGEYLAEEPGRSWEFSAELLGGTRSAVLQESCPDTGPPHPSGFRSWKESCTEDKKAAKPGRAGFPNDSQPEKAAARNSQEERYVEAIPQFTKQASYSKDSQPSVLEDKPSYKQLGNKIDTRNPSRSNIMPQPPKVTPAPPTTQEKQVDPYGTVEQLAPNIGSHSKIIPLDPKYQTLPASFKFETDDCRIVDPQFDRGESTAQRAKGPIHQVRDVRKLVKNTYGALSFHVSEAKPSGFFHPDGSQLPAEPDQTNVPVGSIPTLPMNIQCKSINWKGNREMSYSSSVDKKYWTYAGSTDTSRTSYVFSKTSGNARPKIVGTANAGVLDNKKRYKYGLRVYEVESCRKKASRGNEVSDSPGNYSLMFSGGIVIQRRQEEVAENWSSASARVCIERDINPKLWLPEMDPIFIQDTFCDYDVEMPVLDWGGRGQKLHNTRPPIF
eukprot:g48209.t1